MKRSNAYNIHDTRHPPPTAADRRYCIHCSGVYDCNVTSYDCEDHLLPKANNSSNIKYLEDRRDAEAQRLPVNAMICGFDSHSMTSASQHASFPFPRFHTYLAWYKLNQA